MTSEFYRKSECMGGYLHKFNIYREFDTGVEEVCERCGMDVYFPVVNGQVDNENYIDYHLKEVLPMNHPLFFHEFLYINQLYDLFK